MDANAVFTSKYLKAADLQGHQPIVTLAGVQMETLGIGEDAKECPVLSFAGKDKGLVCNKTNWNTLIGLFGSDTDAWMGKKVKLLTAEVAYQGKMTMAIRVSSQPIAQAPAKPGKAKAAVVEDDASDDIPMTEDAEF